MIMHKVSMLLMLPPSGGRLEAASNPSESRSLNAVVPIVPDLKHAKGGNDPEKHTA